MLQLIELRANPLTIPAEGHPGGVPFSELVFIAAEASYRLGADNVPGKTIETTVWRCLADDAGKQNLIAHLATLLPEKNPLRRYLEQFGVQPSTLGDPATTPEASLDDVLAFIDWADDHAAAEIISCLRDHHHLGDLGSMGGSAADDLPAHLDTAPAEYIEFRAPEGHAGDAINAGKLQDLLVHFGVEAAAEILSRERYGKWEEVPRG